jgi:2-haloacid dehalogenase
MDFDRFDAITFDCYGTLIDWERGILDALGSILAAHGREPPDGEWLLRGFARLEAEVEQGPFRPYRAVLRDVVRGLGREVGFRPTDAEAESFAASVAQWPPFPDTVRALGALGAHYRLAVVSNVDDDLFAGTARQLGVTFAEVVTAQQLRSYKPAPAHFHEVLRRLDLPGDRVLHVAQSLYHDIAPARELGWATVWVNRRAGKRGGGATAPAQAKPDLVVSDLASLADLASPSP